MLVVADQGAAGVGRERGLAGAREAEEDRGVAVRADIGRAVHRHHAGRRQDVVEDREDRLLHLAGIFGAADQDQFLGEVDADHRFRTDAVLGRIGLEARQVDDRIFRQEGFQLGQFGAHQQGADEQAVPGELGNDAHVDAVRRLRAAEQILHEQVLLGRHVRQEIGLQRCERLFGHRAVDVAPVNGIFGLGVTDDELVLGRAAGVLAGLDHQRPVLGEQPLAAADGFLDQRPRPQVPVQGGRSVEALGVETMARNTI